MPDEHNESSLRVYAETLSPAEVAGHAGLLRRFGCDVVLAVRPFHLLAVPRAVRALEDAGVRVALWPMIEDEKGRLVGLVSYRGVLRYLTGLARYPPQPGSGSTAVADIMRKELITVTPDTPTLEAIALMKKHRIGCLPVVQDGHIVALLTEEDFVGIAGKVLESEQAVHDPERRGQPNAAEEAALAAPLAQVAKLQAAAQAGAEAPVLVAADAALQADEALQAEAGETVLLPHARPEPVGT